MVAAAGPLLAACLLLAAAGAAKVWHPSSTSRALRGAGLPSGDALGRLLGVTEISAAGWCAVTGSRPACALVAALYIAFAAFTARLVRSGGSSSCGCFGEADTPASPIHVGVNLGLGALAATAAVRPPGALASILHDQPLWGLPFLALAALGAWSCYLALTLLPDLAVAAGRPPAARRRPERVPR